MIQINSVKCVIYVCKVPCDTIFIIFISSVGVGFEGVKTLYVCCRTDFSITTLKVLFYFADIILKLMLVHLRQKLSIDKC